MKICQKHFISSIDIYQKRNSGSKCRENLPFNTDINVYRKKNL